MCLVAFAIDENRRFPLVVASNRDEFFERASARLDWWTPRVGDPAILGGRDLQSGGTWMGLTAQGRLALLTNVRSADPADANAPSRGKVVTDWLAAREDTGDFWMRTALAGYNGFNLVAADFARGECFWASNTSASPRRLEPGVFGLSNGELDTPWPKVTALKIALRDAVAESKDSDDLAARLFEALANRSMAPDAALPQTGIPVERERQLSAAFIRTPDHRYGTRCSTVIINERIGRGSITHVVERSFDATGRVAQRRVSLTNWPPRLVERSMVEPVTHGKVFESLMDDEASTEGKGNAARSAWVASASDRGGSAVFQSA